MFLNIHRSGVLTALFGCHDQGKVFLKEGWFHAPSTAFRHLPPNSARIGYPTEGALFISVQLSTIASALQKVWVLITLWKQLCSSMHINMRYVHHGEKKKKSSISIQMIMVFVLVLATWVFTEETLDVIWVVSVAMRLLQGKQLELFPPLPPHHHPSSQQIWILSREIT